MKFSKDLYVWTALCIITGIIVTTYLSVSFHVHDTPPIMPLYDTYIHFKYARQMAQGHPFTYNTGDEATSGATSLIYPPLLAIGYLLGFRDLSLAYWALAIGVLAFILSGWLIYRLMRTM